MSYDPNKLKRGLELAKAPECLIDLITLEDGEVTVTTETGAEGRLVVDTIDHVRTATCEITDDYVMKRLSAAPDHILYEQFDLTDGAARTMVERLEFARICEPDPTDAIQEFLEVIEL